MPLAKSGLKSGMNGRFFRGFRPPIQPMGDGGPAPAPDSTPSLQAVTGQSGEAK
jgi:hypothetical protein